MTLTIPSDVELIAYVLYLEMWVKTDEELKDMTDSELKSLGKLWRNELLPARYSEHWGGCTKKPSACARCTMDKLFSNAERILQSIV